MPLRRFRVRFADGTSETVRADSLDEAWAKARRSARKQISTKRQGRKVVEHVAVEPGQVTPPRSGDHPERGHFTTARPAVDPRSGYQSKQRNK